MAADSSDPDTIRILVATDNHVGFEERDPIRKDDSWRTFDEIMQLAHKQDVDMVLLGGDLFHDNKPSRKAMYQVMRTLRKNCLGMRPCQLEFLSDAKEVFEGAFSHVNWQDPDINISIPVFSIHGNHDDPTGDGHYCSLDLLQMAGLVNYFGRVPEADNIHVKPVLLQKGKTKLALYGLSNVRDERMHRTFRDNKVRFYRPDHQKTDFFNLLTVHQNHHAHTATGYLPENLIPDFMNLVVWGHEHECLIDPRHNPETNFHVMQPGSSVATSLVPGEAVTKQIAIVSIAGKDFRVNKIPLRTVRPFVTREIVLAKDKRFKGLDKKKDNRQDITKRLIGIVNEMIGEASSEWRSIQTGGGGVDDDEREDPPLPLIRLKVEYTAPDGADYEVENPQRFSNRFVGKVANTNDIVYFYRKKALPAKRLKAGEHTEGLVETIEAMRAADTIQVETLAHEYLAAQSLKLLPQAPFGDAVNQYVTKDDKHAMENFVLEQLAGQVKDLLDMGGGENGLSLDKKIEQIRKRKEAEFRAGQRKQVKRFKMKERPGNWDSDLDGHWEHQPGAIEEVEVEQPVISGTADHGSGHPSTRAAALCNNYSKNDDEDVLMDDVDGRPTRKARAKRGTAAGAKPTKAKAMPKAASAKTTTAAKKSAPSRSRKKMTNSSFIDSENEEAYGDVRVDESEDDEAFEDGKPVSPARASTTTTGTIPPKRAQPGRRVAAATATQTALNFTQSEKSGGRSKQGTLEISDDEISEDNAFESMPATRATRG